MIASPDTNHDANDLVLTREIDVPPHLVWRAWTEPEQMKKWFAPRPWTTVECEVDLRPGGICRIVMRSPEGEEFPSEGCYLEVVPNQRLTTTDALGPGFRPAEKPFFTAIITMEAIPTGTRYTARAMHKNDADRETHEKMGFYEGWGTCLDQMVEMIKRDLGG